MKMALQLLRLTLGIREHCSTVAAILRIEGPLLFLQQTEWMKRC
jgi:hypothetical protein